ncbi:zinc-ribbon domain-containing protein [Thermodesulfobacteriota bacterium]
MPLTKCPDCGKEVSSDAPSCPNCGSPIKTKHTTIEKTSKKFKGQMIIAIPIFIIGILLTIVGLSDENMSYAVPGLIMAGGGAIWWLIIKILIWWRHE